MTRIQPKPVQLYDVAFRSKLEATFAVVFELLGLCWEYEPITDLEFAPVRGWLPDFQLLGANGESVLVDVKPWSRSLLASDRRLKRMRGKVMESWKAGGKWGIFRSNEFGRNPFIWITCGELDFIDWDNQMAGWGGYLEYLFQGHDFHTFQLDSILTPNLTYEPDRDEWEPYLALAGVKDISKLWAACRHVVNRRGKLLALTDVEPFWNTNPKCDGKGYCYCDPSDHDCPECGGFKRAEYDTCYNCRDD